MRIVRIAVQSLFDMFDHEIRLNQVPRITIMHGPNGIGKTVLMRMVKGLFDTEYSIFREVPFAWFEVELDSGERLRIGRPSDGSEGPQESLDSDGANISELVPLEFSYFATSTSDPDVYQPDILETRREKYLQMIESIPDLMQLERRRWIEMKSDAILTFGDVVLKYGLEAQLQSEVEPEWLTRIKQNVDTTMIQADRLRGQKHFENRRFFTSSYRSSRNRVSNEPRVNELQEEIVSKIAEVTERYAEKSQAIDRSFPNRLMESKGSSNIGPSDLQAKLHELQSKSGELMSLGLIEPGEAPDIPGLEDTQETLSVVLSIYVQDIEDKLSVFDTISEQLSKLVDIINARLMFKTLAVRKGKGFEIKAHDSSEINVSSLSSGEQHELVLLYQLLFHVQQDSLIMIDEPELSLHVNWQRRFVKDIQEIIQLRNFDVLIATHSPQIVADKQKWMVKLEYPNGDK